MRCYGTYACLVFELLVMSTGVMNAGLNEAFDML